MFETSCKYSSSRSDEAGSFPMLMEAALLFSENVLHQKDNAGLTFSECSLILLHEDLLFFLIYHFIFMLYIKLTFMLSISPIRQLFSQALHRKDVYICLEICSRWTKMGTLTLIMFVLIYIPFFSPPCQVFPWSRG